MLTSVSSLLDGLHLFFHQWLLIYHCKVWVTCLKSLKPCSACHIIFEGMTSMALVYVHVHHVHNSLMLIVHIPCQQSEPNKKQFHLLPLLIRLLESLGDSPYQLLQLHVTMKFQWGYCVTWMPLAILCHLFTLSTATSIHSADHSSRLDCNVMLTC